MDVIMKDPEPDSVPYVLARAKGEREWVHNQRWVAKQKASHASSAAKRKAKAKAKAAAASNPSSPAPTATQEAIVDDPAPDDDVEKDKESTKGNHNRNLFWLPADISADTTRKLGRLDRIFPGDMAEALKLQLRCATRAQWPIGIMMLGRKLEPSYEVIRRRTKPALRLAQRRNPVVLKGAVGVGGRKDGGKWGGDLTKRWLRWIWMHWARMNEWKEGLMCR